MPYGEAGASHSAQREINLMNAGEPLCPAALETFKLCLEAK
jgi:hypothetical protein